MGKYRKGEKPVPRYVAEWTPDHPVAGSMRRGSPWFYAWLAQSCTPYVRLTKLTKITEARLREIEAGASFTRVELEALARAWWVTPEGLLASMPDPERVVG